MKALPETLLTFYGPKSLQIHIVPTEEADEFYQKEVGVLLTPPSGKQKLDNWMGLETKRELQIKYEDFERPACDVAISGLGWISVEPVSQLLRTSDSSEGETVEELSLLVHVPKPVEIFVRTPLPVGKAGGECYQYRELTEKEMDIRPKWVSLPQIFTKNAHKGGLFRGIQILCNKNSGTSFRPVLQRNYGSERLGQIEHPRFDLLCFVLGITNLQQVRASNVVYKQGQAGITKATVSVVFDNSDRTRSPLGYEDCPEITVTRQIVVGGRNKYLINGHLAQPSRVQNLFHSVQLNVNNPHFLIMQGRITKVLNMKPPEILSMLEEAAGTRMYETKKEAALKTLEKKQSKVDEIDKLLDQEILPALEKLRKERMQYMQWSNGNAELDRMKRYCIAYEYVQAEKIRDNAVQGLEELKNKISEIDNGAEKMLEEIQVMEKKATSVLKNQEDILMTEKENAAKVAFNREIGKPSVTLEGDIFQPSGLLTGGSRRGGGELLRQLHALAEAELKLSFHQKRLSDIDAKVHESKRARLIMEMEAVKTEHASLECQLDALKKQINDLTLEVDSCKIKVASLKNDHDQAQSELNSARTKIKEHDSQITSIVKEQQRLQHRMSETNLERKRLEKEVKRMETDQKDCALMVEKLIEKHPWIATEKQLFGRTGSDYDFASRDTCKAREEFEKLQAEQSGLEKRVNKKVMAMFEKAEDEYNDLLSKKNIIENDKSKIKLVIEELDEKKETLKVTWVKVNKDFGSVFSTLLPGTMAKLEPPEGCSFLDGLEVRVAFGGVWKQSLSELSGGQRSLLALSLILALLLFKPAPLYILDEVDAALDLSHTQNIGRMIRTHFPHSQFIVVSLKEGMFNNANVLFRTKFVDGVSTVQRTVANKQNK
ncbi:Structural maintenance of chromosomes protein 2-1 [Abeliophyllum distichum]|uniref:Structural maintenance of chromosomes protein 2-1 n=1 Tax=Abeliophyllum distichum TaxID=126358 RepID=A0ABD1VTZ4_9LAMI